MSAINISLEVHCLGPSWIQSEKNRYRVYVNDEMLTERDWIWTLNQYIRENIWVNIIPKTLNVIKLEPVLQKVRFPEINHVLNYPESKSIAKFAIKNVSVNYQTILGPESEQLEVSFHI